MLYKYYDASRERERDSGKTSILLWRSIRLSTKYLKVVLYSIGPFQFLRPVETAMFHFTAPDYLSLHKNPLKIIFRNFLIETNIPDTIAAIS